MVRSIEVRDLDQIKEIHEKFYKDEFSLPDFVHNYLCAFANVSEHGEVISVCGVRKIVELVGITNKDFSPRIRQKALIELLEASTFMADKFGFDQLHAFIQDENWLKHLKKYGFSDTKGKSIFINF